MEDIEILLKKEKQWFLMEGKMNELEWVREGTEIYRKMMRVDLNNIQARKKMAKHLIKHVGDIKNRLGNFRVAKELLKETLKSYPEDIEAMYHLGYVYFFEEYPAKAIRYFEKVVHHNDLDTEKRINALLAFALCQHQLGNAEEASDLYEKATTELKEKKTDNKTSTLFQLAKMSISQPQQEVKRFFLEVMDQDVRSVNEEEVEQLINEMNGEYWVLDFRYDHEPKLFFEIEKWPLKLPFKEAKLLRELVLSNCILSKNVLNEKLWQDNDNPDRVKKFIGKLKKSLRSQIKITDLIGNTPRLGYKWNGPRCYVIRDKNNLL